MSNKIPNGIILSCKSVKLEKKEIEFFSKVNPFGFILFSRNFKSKEQIQKLISDLKIITKNQQVLIFVDQEGGKVQRFNNYEFSNIPDQKYFGDIYYKSKKKALKLSYLNARLIAHELKEIGVDVNCSPVLDLYKQNANKIIDNRSFSSNEKVVTEIGRQYCIAFLDGGILPVIKHFPGHGRAKVDSHLDLPIIKTSKNKLLNHDIKPFKKLNDQIFIMISHILYDKLDKKIAPYSKKILIKLLKEKLKFNGLIISDDISMLALKGSLIERIKNCYKGGCDIVMYCSGNLKEMKNIYKFTKPIEKKKFEHFKSYLTNNKLKKINIKKARKKLYESRTI
tara:strand:- start:1407 stop:2420 length:1014 start_codon:yes stop_codon:yes gene_type:complete